MERNSDFLPHYETEDEAIEMSGWDNSSRVIDGKLYCSECWVYDDYGGVEVVGIPRDEKREGGVTLFTI